MSLFQNILLGVLYIFRASRGFSFTHKTFWQGSQRPWSWFGPSFWLRSCALPDQHLPHHSLSPLHLGDIC